MKKQKNSSKKLVVVADDFGFCASVNLGILKSYTQGIVTEISLMVNSNSSKEAIELIKKKFNSKCWYSYNSLK